MARTIGPRMTLLCELVEKMQPCTTYQVWARFDGVNQENTRNYIKRAEEYGLLTVEKIIRGRALLELRTVDGWREILQDRLNEAAEAMEYGILTGKQRAAMAQSTVQNAIKNRPALQRVWG